ncbi:MAG: glycosyltransferase family 4 protein [Pseudomonadales bacterium]|nr:glycosyltransferase family 4 protein [Pseudomonadales bacterium]
MNVCLVIDDYLPDSIKVGAKMMHELALEMMAAGHHVTIITPQVDLSAHYKIDQLDGVAVCRFRSGQIKNVGRVKRAINETLLSWRAWRQLKPYLIENPHDLIVYYSPSIFWGGLVIRLKKLWGAKSYLVLRDFFPQWVVDSGMLKSRSPITLYFRLFEWLNHKAADVVGIQSPANIAVFESFHSLSQPLQVLYNWAPELPSVDSSGQYRQALGLDGKVVFFYGGNIGAAQDMMNIVRLACALENDERVHFLLVGNGDEAALVRQAIEGGRAGNMTLLPSVSQQEYEVMLAEFDVGLFSLHREHSAHNFPGKLLGYMAHEKPILGSVNGGNDVQSVIESAGAGFICLNGNDDLLLNYARKLIEDAELRSSMGQNSRRLLGKTFSVKSAMKKILATCI